MEKLREISVRIGGSYVNGLEGSKRRRRGFVWRPLWKPRRDGGGGGVMKRSG